MRHSRNALNRCGEIMLSSKRQQEVDDAHKTINEWRTDHVQPLELLKNEIASLLTSNNISPILISQRLKRLSSIQNKLDLNPQMGLGGMQDIGGIRIVLDDMDTLVAVFNLLDKCNLGDFEYQRTTNYVDTPKSSGYRSIHFVYKYKSKDSIYNGLRFELQIRTKLQHTWATALETVDIHSNTPLKAGYGDDDWLDFFKLVSSLFAFKELSPRILEHEKLSVQDVMRKYYQHNKAKRNLEMLRAFSVVLEKSFVETNDEISDYYLLTIDLEKNVVHINNYMKEDYEEATSSYYELEKQLSANKAIVLVATSSYSQLQEAYPSFFSDIEEFISNLTKVEENCINRGLI